MPTERTCPRCGTALSFDSLEGLCPTCVGRAAFVDDPSMPRDAGESADVFGPALSPEIEAELAQRKPDEAGERIGNYKLIEQIGQGGFGTVWVAEQECPVRRRVALKIIKLGMDTKEVIARFEQERQALAMMDHPHIAKVFDAGATQWGRPFFVMELVRGTKITDYCDQANLPTAERLQLFIAVCQAVQHAHQKGIIHRDLKPSNILVTLHDGVPVPKVIDFGVAKAIQQERLTELTLHTRFAQMIGTPLYMSPEQAEISGIDIDTRSDIYSLGVLLYELLTGRTPFDPGDLMKQGLDEIRRTIREQEPQTPSMFVSSMTAELRTSVAQRRRSDGAKLIVQIRGDLDWIVMKALEKDRARRYETANGLAMDIQRHLADEPVLARPPSHLYRLRRLGRRNRVAFAAAGAVTVALVIGLSVAIHSYLNERKARAGETTQREIAENRTRQAQASAVAAQASAREAAASEINAKRFLYAADMNLAQQALRVNNVGRARHLLDRHRPANGEPDLRGWEWRYLWQECRSGAQAMLTKRDGVRAFSVSFSPDSAWLAVGYFDGQVELWDVAKRQLARLVQKPFDQRAHVAFSPRGDILAATMGRSVVKTHNVVTAADTILCTVGDYVRDLSFSPDGELLAVLSAGPDLVQVLRVEGGKPVMSYPLPKGGGMHFNNARLSPDKQRLYVSCGAFAEPKVRCVSVPDARLIWELGDRKDESRDVEDEIYIGFSAMDLSPDGRTLVVATGYGGPALVLDAKTGQRFKKLDDHTGWICELAFSKDGKWLASASGDQTLRLWDAATWRPLADPLRGHSQEVAAVAFTNDGRFLASGSKDGVVLLWDINAARPENGSRFLPTHIEKAISLPGGQTVLGRASDGKWSLIDLVTLGEEALPPAEISTASGLPRLTPEKWLRKSRPETIPRSGLTGVLSKPVLSPDYKLVAVASENGFVGLYEAEKQTPIEIIRGNQGAVFGVAFSPDSQRLALASGGREGIEIWDVLTRQMLISLTTPKGLLNSVEFTGDGNTLLVGSGEPRRRGTDTCQFWRAPSWEEINDAEHAGGMWPQTEAFRPTPPRRTLDETKNLLEQAYRKKLADSRAQSPKDSVRRDESLANLAGFLREQGRSAEAEPLLRELLANLRARNPQDDDAVLATVSSLTRVVLSLEESARTAGDTAKVTNHAQQADALISEQLAFLAQSSARNSKDTAFSLKVAALQVWFGRNADHGAICRRLIQQAEEHPETTAAEIRAIQSWCLNPSSDPELRERVLRLARQVPDLGSDNWRRAWYQQALGMAEYRSGNDAAAEQALIRANEAAEQFLERDRGYRLVVQSLTNLYRAMILFRNGREADARKLFVEAEALMKPLPADDRQVFQNEADLNDLLLWLAYKEAKAMLQPEAQAAPTKPAGK